MRTVTVVLAALLVALTSGCGDVQAKELQVGSDALIEWVDSCHDPTEKFWCRAPDVSELLNGGADPNAISQSGSPVLHQVILWGLGVEVVQVLIARGADVSQKDKEGRTPLLHLRYLDQGVLDALLAAGANINAQDATGQTALMNAVISLKPIPYVEALLVAGADRSVMNSRGETALAIAEKRLEELRNSSVAPDAPSGIVEAHQRTPLRFQKVIEMLGGAIAAEVGEALVSQQVLVPPLRTLWGQESYLYVDTGASPCAQVPCDKGLDKEGCDGLTAVKVGCAAVAVGQLINYYLENGYASGWLDTMLPGIEVYPRPWSKGVSGKPACTHPGFPVEDSYTSAGWGQLKRFLWHVGIGLDIDYGADGSSLTVYPSEKFPFALTLERAEKLASLLEDRFQFKVIAAPSAEVNRLDELAVGIMQAIDSGRPVLLRLAQSGSELGHVTLVQGYRISTTDDASWGETPSYEFLLNAGGGPSVPLQWVRGDGEFDLGSFRSSRFQMIDVMPVAASAVPVSR